ncbi:hypothetical protein [Flavisolibacter nicotianae]|uniref:hypothetical protein n=1 Tax=Flavisolibacter nicotianae TaxID=2364882 RepID=UPI000EB01FFE|nr:hypothetical protein [Flavisolibacter nicotianae]
MKILLIAFLFISLTLFTFSCKQTSSATLNYPSLRYDTNRIAVFRWDTTKYQFPTNSDLLPLTQEDLKIVDSLLKDAVDSFNMQISPRMVQSFNNKVALDSFIIKHENYRYQYFPYKDVNGQRIVTIIGFSGEFHPWKMEVYQAGIHYGMRRLELRVNLSEKTRDNIRSGDFG